MEWYRGQRDHLAFASIAESAASITAPVGIGTTLKWWREVMSFVDTVFNVLGTTVVVSPVVLLADPRFFRPVRTTAE